jgi:hypothetical protein
MGLIREPEGVDFVINSRRLTKEEEERLSQFIREYKKKHAKKLQVGKHSREKPIRASRVYA